MVVRRIPCRLCSSDHCWVSSVGTSGQTWHPVPLTSAHPVPYVILERRSARGGGGGWRPACMVCPLSSPVQGAAQARSRPDHLAATAHWLPSWDTDPTTQSATGYYSDISRRHAQLNVHFVADCWKSRPLSWAQRKENKLDYEWRKNSCVLNIVQTETGLVWDICIT